MEFDTIDASLVEGGFEWVVACGGCSGGVGGAVEVVMVIMTSDGFPTPSLRSLSTGEIIFEVRARSTEIVFQNIAYLVAVEFFLHVHFASAT